MNSYVSLQGTVIIIERGEELVASLASYTKDRGLSSAWLQSGLGGADSATLSFYDIETKAYIDKTFDEPLEIVSLQGNLSWVSGEPFWHVHGTFGTRSYQTVSGHVKALRIALTGELLLIPLETQLTRSDDETTGLKLIQ